MRRSANKLASGRQTEKVLFHPANSKFAPQLRESNLRICEFTNWRTGELGNRRTSELANRELDPRAEAPFGAEKTNKRDINVKLLLFVFN